MRSTACAGIGAADAPRCIVFNKIDLAQRSAAVERAACGRIDAVWVSARSGNGLELAWRTSERAKSALRSTAAEQTTRTPAAPERSDAAYVIGPTP